LPPLTIGIDLGGTKMAGVVFSDDNRVLDRRTIPRPASAAAMHDEPIRLAESLMDPSVVAVGVGAAGLVDRGEGTLVWGPNVAGERVAIRSRFESELGVPAFVDNDANLAALAEVRIGAGRGFRHMLLVTLGTGIGGGWIVSGEPYRGRGFAGEIGHMRVQDDGPACTCGLTGCWETVCSGRWLDEVAARLAGGDGMVAQLAAGTTPTGAQLTDAALAGDPVAAGELENMAAWLGRGIANLVAAFDPEIVVVGGGVSRAGDLLLDPAKRAMAASLEGATHRRPTPIVAAELGADAGVIGGAIYARESLA